MSLMSLGFRSCCAVLILGIAMTMVLPEVALADEFRVNTLTHRQQLIGDVVVDRQSEDFLVVWTSYVSPGDDDWNTSIQGQRYDADGAPTGGQFQINTWTTTAQLAPVAAVSAVDGTIMVAWQHIQPVNDPDEDVRARMFLSDGTPLGPDFRVNSHPGSVGFVGIDTDIDALSSGDFVVVWEGIDSESSDLEIQARLIQADGTPRTAQFPVPQEGGRSPRRPVVAAHDTNGEFLVAWIRIRATNPIWRDIVGRRFDASGTPLGDVFLISDDSNSSRFGVDVAFEPTSQNYVVTWVDSEEIRMRRVSANGMPIASGIMVNTWTVDVQTSPTVAVDPVSGDFQIAWLSFTTPNQPGERPSIRAQRYNSDATPAGNEFQINVVGRPDSGARAVLTSSDGMGSGSDMFAIWSDLAACGDNDHGGISASFDPVTEACSLTIDGFESGDFSAWSLAVGN